MNKRILLLIALFALCSCVNQTTSDSSNLVISEDFTASVCVRGEGERFQTDKLTFKITARHIHDYGTANPYSINLNNLTIVRRINSISENDNKTLIGVDKKIGTITEFATNKYSVNSKVSDLVSFGDSFTLEYGEFLIEYAVDDSGLDKHLTGGINSAFFHISSSSDGYMVHTPQELIKKDGVI